MSVFGGSPIDTSLVQTAQAQETAGRARDRQRAVEERTQRYTDLLDLRVASVESAEAVRQFPQNDSEQAEQERQGRADRHEEPGEPDRHIDVTG